MSFTIQEFARVRPFLYHLTARENIERVRRLGRLEPAANIVEAAGRPDLIATRRRGHVAVEIGGETIMIRDQAPLHRGNMRLDPEWTFERFVAHLNGRVFMWPGREDGPISYGVRHFMRYEAENPIILRVGVLDLIDANAAVEPLFCRYNSGSPRWTRGVASPRGATTFVSGRDATFRATQAVEVTFAAPVLLPASTEIGLRPQGPWSPLRDG